MFCTLVCSLNVLSYVFGHHFFFLSRSFIFLHQNVKITLDVTICRDVLLRLGNNLFRFLFFVFYEEKFWIRAFVQRDLNFTSPQICHFNFD